MQEYLKKEELTHKTYYDLIRDLKKMGFHLDTDGGISAFKNKKVLIRLTSQDLKKLHYNTRLSNASKYPTVLDEEMKLLARLYQIKPDDLQQKLNTDNRTENFYRDLLIQGNQMSSLQEVINDRQLEILIYHHRYYLLDRKNHQLLNIQRLIGDHNLDLNRIETKNIDAFGAIDIVQTGKTSNALGQLTQLFDQTIAESDRGSDQKRKKRKQRKF